MWKLILEFVQYSNENYFNSITQVMTHKGLILAFVFQKRSLTHWYKIHSRRNTLVPDPRKILSRKLFVVLNCKLFKVKEKYVWNTRAHTAVLVQMYLSVCGYILFTIHPCAVFISGLIHIQKADIGDPNKSGTPQIVHDNWNSCLLR